MTVFPGGGGVQQCLLCCVFRGVATAASPAGSAGTACESSAWARGRQPETLPLTSGGAVPPDKPRGRRARPQGRPGVRCDHSRMASPLPALHAKCCLGTVPADRSASSLPKSLPGLLTHSFTSTRERAEGLQGPPGVLCTPPGWAGQCLWCRVAGRCDCVSMCPF